MHIFFIKWEYAFSSHLWDSFCIFLGQSPLKCKDKSFGFAPVPVLYCEGKIQSYQSLLVTWQYFVVRLGLNVA